MNTRTPLRGPAAGCSPDDGGPPAALRALLAAECAAEAEALPALEAEDLQQAVWLRWLERTVRDGAPPRGAGWIRRAVRAEVRKERRRAAREVRFAEDPVAGRAPQGGHRYVTSADGTSDAASAAEAPVLTDDCRRSLTIAIDRLPGHCPAVLRGLVALGDLTYPEIARELGMSQGSVGPLRSRCLECLRRMLTVKVAGGGTRGMVR